MKKTMTRPANLPARPGVYIFKNAEGSPLYIGKAKNLRARVAQYFGKNESRPQIPHLLAEASGLEYIVVDNELESLYLERNLIQKHRPKYNIDLKDDKNFAYITLDYSFPIPQIGYARKFNLNAKDIVYFGPYTAAGKIKATLRTLRNIFPYCSAQKNAGKPCFYYHLHRCPGVCVGAISREAYLKHLENIKAFLSGKTGPAAKRLELAMRQAARKKHFEAAGRIRDQLFSLKTLEARQKVILTRPEDWDIVASWQESFFACVSLFQIRGGRLNATENFVYEVGEQGMDSPLEKFLESYYLEASNLPRAIFIEKPVPALADLERSLEKRPNKKIPIKLPKKGKAAQLISLAQKNAQEYLERWLEDKAGSLDKLNRALIQLQRELGLPALPRLIECYDISNIQGTNAVGSLVVFKDGLPQKSLYKKFRIRRKNTPDDFAMLQEVLNRRLEKIGAQDAKWPKPDLIVIDGGKGQLSAAKEILDKKNQPIPIIGLAKRIEEIFLPRKMAPIRLGHDQPALQLLQRLRDETHRFGITYHRQIRSKEAVRSALDDIAGIGPKTKKLLKAKFGSVANIRRASLQELSETLGKKLAEKIRREL